MSVLGPLAVGILTALSASACADDEQPPIIPATLEPPCELTSRWYRVTEVELPSQASHASQLGFNLDLDPSGRTRNGGGRALATLMGVYEEVPAQLAAAIERKLEGPVIWLLEIATCGDGSSAHARIGLHRGRAEGGAIVAVVSGLPAVGEVVDGRVVAAQGFGVAPATLFADVLDTAAEIVWIDADGMAFDLSHDGDDLSGRMGMGLPDALAAVAAPLAAFFDARLEGRDCDACWASDEDYELGCYPCTLDQDRNGAISPAEIEADYLMGIFFAPDVDLFYEDRHGGELYWPRHDLLQDRLAFGVGFRAVPVDVVALE